MTLENATATAYRYAKSACCRMHWIDYRDIAHTVIVRLLERGHSQIGHVAYIYLMVRSALAAAIRSERPNSAIHGLDPDRFPCHPFRHWHDLASIVEVANEKELQLIRLVEQGHTIQEAAKLAGYSGSTGSVIFFRLRQKIQKEMRRNEN